MKLEIRVLQNRLPIAHAVLYLLQLDIHRIEKFNEHIRSGLLIGPLLPRLLILLRRMVVQLWIEFPMPCCRRGTSICDWNNQEVLTRPAYQQHLSSHNYPQIHHIDMNEGHQGESLGTEQYLRYTPLR